MSDHPSTLLCSPKCIDQVSADSTGNVDTQLMCRHLPCRQPIYLPGFAAKPLLSVFSNEMLYFPQYSSFILSLIPSIFRSKLKLGYHRHIFIHSVVLIHIGLPILAEFLVLIHIQWKWIPYCTQRLVSLCTSHDWVILRDAVSSCHGAPF